MGAGAQTPLHGRLADVAAPVLLVAGAEDARFAAIARELAAAIPNARAALVPDAGHAVHLEKPRAFTALLRDFLARADAGRAPFHPPHAEEMRA
ncbi:MAG: hypothetical protein DCC71_25605 [Proteobacteria bacterium]|nr:MAG: hypothetical protein DCC71_25605 [Pseudomonadota bacterium]